MSQKQLGKQVWIDRDGRRRTDAWHPQRKSDGLLPVLSLTMPSAQNFALWNGQIRETLVDPPGHARTQTSENMFGDAQALESESQEQGRALETSVSLPTIDPEVVSPEPAESSSEFTDSPHRLPSLYYAADDKEGLEGDRAPGQPLSTLADSPFAMQRFLEFRQEEKRRRIGAIENGDFPARTAQMLREVFCPPTPDPAIKRRVRPTDVPRQTFLLMPHETLLYEHFRTYAHSSDAHEGNLIRVPSQEDFGANRSDEQPEEIAKLSMDLRGFIGFMKDTGLVPRPLVQEGQKTALPIQYSLAVQAFKIGQNTTSGTDHSERFGFPEFKDCIHKFIFDGTRIVQEQIDQRLQKIEKLEMKIARHVPNSPDPIQALKRYFSQLFDTVFDAYIYFDHAGDWQVTMSGFRQQCKKLGLPLTGADLYAALLNKTQMNFLDQYTFIQTFGWYPLIVKPKLQVEMYKVQPIEASLHRMFCFMSDGVRAEDALAEVKRVELLAEERLAKSAQLSNPHKRGSLVLETPDVPLMMASNKNFIGRWRGSNPDGMTSPLYAVYAGSTGSPLPGSDQRSGSNSPVGAGLRRESEAGGSPRGGLRRGSVSPRRDAQRREGPSFKKLSSPIEEAPESGTVTPEQRLSGGEVSGSTGLLMMHERSRSFVRRTSMRSECQAADPNAAIDSADHAMAFQTFVDFMKALGLVPVADSPKGQDKDGEPKEAEQKTDLGSAEFEVALEIFRETTGKGDRLEWQEFKDCLYTFLRVGLRRLQSRSSGAEEEMLKMRARMAKFAPSSDNPLAAFKEVLAVRFDSVYEAFVYFDLSGDWQVTKAEVKNMLRRLLSPLTNVDVDAALNQVFLTSGISINAIDFVRKLKWTQEVARKVLEDYTIAPSEKELHQEFLQFSHKSKDHEQHDTPKGHGKQAQGIPEDGGGGGELGPVPKKRLTKEEEALKTQEAEVRLGQEGFMDLAISNGIVKLSSSVQNELAQQCFQLANWAEDKDNEISWPELKHVLWLFYRSGPTMLQPILDAKRQELRMKRMELYQKVKTQPDSVKAMRESLSDRFESVFDAFCYFDVAGDGYVTVNDIKNMLPKLRMAMTVADLSSAIMKIMKIRDNAGNVVVDPMEFCKNLAWHPKPKAGPGLRRALDAAKPRRLHIAEKAHAKAEAAPAPIPTEPDILPDDAQTVDRLLKQIDEILALQKELQQTTEVCGCPIDSTMALPDAEVARRKELAVQDLRERALRASDRGIIEMLDRAAKNKMRLQEMAQQRSQDDDYARKMLGLKEGAQEPPTVEMLMQWVPKTERQELRQQHEKLSRLQEATQRLTVVKEVLGVPVKDLAVSTKDRYRKKEIDDHNREVKRIAVQGIHTMVLDGLEKAKLRRKEIVGLARQRAAALRGEWSEVPFPSESVQQALGWFTEMAKKRVEQERRAQHLQMQSAQGDAARAKGPASPRPVVKKQLPLLRDKGPISPERIKASVAPMVHALQHRFADIYDAWAFFDADGSWEMSKSEFRKRSQGLRLYEENVDVEAVLRAVDGDGAEKVNPHDFVRVLKWHPMPVSLAELRAAFDAAARRRAVASEVAMRRSRMAAESRERAMSAADEVATEAQRAEVERRAAEEGLRARRQRKLREMAGPPRLLVEWAVQQDLKDLQQLRLEVEQRRSVRGQLEGLAAADVKGVPAHELPLEYHRLALALYQVPPADRARAAGAIKVALRDRRHARRVREAELRGGSAGEASAGEAEAGRGARGSSGGLAASVAAAGASPESGPLSGGRGAGGFALSASERGSGPASRSSEELPADAEAAHRSLDSDPDGRDSGSAGRASTGLEEAARQERLSSEVLDSLACVGCGGWGCGLCLSRGRSRSSGTRSRNSLSTPQPAAGRSASLPVSEPEPPTAGPRASATGSRGHGESRSGGPAGGGSLPEAEGSGSGSGLPRELRRAPSRMCELGS